MMNGEGLARHPIIRPRCYDCVARHRPSSHLGNGFFNKIAAARAVIREFLVRFGPFFIYFWSQEPYNHVDRHSGIQISSIKSKFHQVSVTKQRYPLFYKKYIFFIYFWSRDSLWDPRYEILAWRPSLRDPRYEIQPQITSLGCVFYPFWKHFWKTHFHFFLMIFNDV